MLGALLGNYRIVEQLGEGGMGVVYIGRHEQLGRRVVVKVLRPEMSRNADMAKRLFNEAQAATAIRNPGIAQVFDYGETSDGRVYFVMELLEGESLTARLAQRRLDYVECCRIGRQIANVLQAAHEAGITHRDLKPDNLFLVPDPEVIGGERVKVLDFGLAKLANEARPVNTRTGLVMGTPSYMSPEQCRGIRNADARSDIYSLGCILFKMACGRAPFVSDAVGDVIVAHVQEPAPNLGELRPEIPAGLSALIQKMLAKNPDSRPQTMAAVSQAFDEILGTRTSQPLSAPLRPPTPPPTPPPSPEDPPSLTLPDPIPMNADPFPMAANPAPMTLEDTMPAPPVGPSGDLAPASPARASRARPTSEMIAARTRWLPFVLASLLVAGVAIAIAIVLAASGSGSGSDSDWDARPISDGVIEAPASLRVEAVDTLEARCQAHETERRWSELERCADDLEPLDPDRAAALRSRAVQEIKSASRIAAVEAALRKDNLKRAKAALEHVWPESVEYQNIKRKYEIAEAQATGDLAAELARVKDTDCRKYKALLRREQAYKPANVTEEAARRTPCSPPAKCDADALDRRGQAQLAAGQLVESFMSYEEAYACNRTPARMLKAFTLACRLRNVDKARSYWKQLATSVRTQAAGTCARNGITVATLNAP